ncbi:hypothetical protein V5799_010510 [Amblyomma americanum]|uniref:Uncharacterized protein n=1 Tax=Amblyomma americanum TaxID=6943 RepID=A0AAQ4EJQ0_AMBAM
MLLFASRQTTESLRVTLLSALDIIDELHKFKQRFFVIVRYFHGDVDHPTIIQFSQIYRLLFTPVKNAVKGNCSGAAESVLVSLHDSLGEKAKAAAELRNAVEEKQCKKLLSIRYLSGESDDLGDYGYEIAGPEEMVVYYLAGYVHKKITKAMYCKDCQVTLTAAPEHASPSDVVQRHFTDLRSFKPGCLREPSLRLYTVIKMESIVHKAIEKRVVFGDLFWEVLDRLEELCLQSIVIFTAKKSLLK